MQKKKKEVKHYDLLNEVPTAVSKDGSTVSVAGQVFRRTVLESAAVKRSEEIKEQMQLDEALADLDQSRTQEQEWVVVQIEQS